ncbi:MAG: prolipoprotein diacylglyceryl transferase [Fibrobacter sp.]|nr:prolipoprotein diacylglyceryl transferase [Fibrobacter sp.]
MQYSWWNLIPQNLDPTFFHIGSFPVRWYGLMYLAAFFTVYHLMLRISKRDKLGVTKEQLDTYASWVIGGILVGARLGYVVFYNLSYYLKNPLEIFLPFSFNQGFHFTGIAGMSYHGGLIGAFRAATYCIKKEKWDYWKWSDLTFVAVPLGYTWGRLGNFINGELYGRVTTSPIGMLFPTDATQMLRHPSQIYEMLFEGVILFAILYWLTKKPLFKTHIMSLYLMGYGFFRFIIEYFREPDAHIGLSNLGFTRGQWLCFAMIAAGIAIWIWQEKKPKTIKE